MWYYVFVPVCFSCSCVTQWLLQVFGISRLANCMLLVDSKYLHRILVYTPANTCFLRGADAARFNILINYINRQNKKETTMHVQVEQNKGRAEFDRD